MSNTIKGYVRVVAASLTMASTVLSLAGFAAFPVVAHAVAPADFGLREGDTISASGSSDPDIYIVNDWGYKRLFVNPAIFTLYGHLSWAGVKAVSPATRDAFGTSGLFRNCETGDQKVYGLDVISEDVANLRWVNTSGAQAVIDDPNFFKKVFCINSAEKALYGTGADYTSVLQVPAYTRGGGAVSGPIGASLASDNPASGTLVQGQASADLAHFTFTGTGSVTNIVLKRLGVSADATLTNVYLYDGAKRLTDSATVSSGMITFNDSQGLFTVSGSKTISVKSDILSTATGETIGVQLTGYTPSGNAAVATSLSGNLHSIATATLATVILAADASITPSANTALDPASDVVVWQDTATVGTRYVWLNSIQFRVIGSVVVGDLRNFRLFADGVQVGSAIAQTDANGYVVFDVSGSPKKLETGGRVLKVLADVVGGSNKNFTVSIRQAPDISTTDSQYNAGILATQTGSFPAEAGQQDISQGTLTITKKTDSPSGDVVKDASGVVLARFELKANGERLKVENLRANVTYAPLGVTGAASAFTLRNGALFVDGVQVGSTASLCGSGDASCSGYTAAASTSYTQYNLGSSLIVEPGTPKILEIRADLYDDDGANQIAATDLVTANLVVGSSNVQRLVSLNYVASTAAAGNQLTVKTGSFTAGKYTGYANQSVVTPQTQLKLGHFTLTAASSENINVNTLVLDLDGTNDGSVASKTADVFLKVYNDTGALILTTSPKATVSSTASNSYSVNFTIPMSKTYQVEVIGNLNTVDLTSKTLITHLLASGITANSSTSTSTTAAVGQTITTANGSLTQANGVLPAARLINGGQTATAYQFTLTPAYDDFTLEEVYVDLSSQAATDVGAVANLFLKEGSTVIGSATINATTSSASFTGLNRTLAQSAGTKTYTVEVQFSNVGVGANLTNGNVTLRLDGAKFRNSAGTYNTNASTLPLAGLAVTNTGNANIVVKGYPTFTNQSLPTSVLNAGTISLFKTSVSATGGQIAWNDIVFTVSSTSAAGTFGPNAAGWKLFENGVDITPSDTGATASVSDTGSSTRVEFEFATERAITAGSSVTLELRTTAGGTIAANDSVTTQIANPSGSTVTVGTSTAQALTNASFIWTDQSAVTHGTGTSDWFTDGLVKSLAESQSLTK